MVLEDRGVDKEVFIELQELAKMRVYTARDSLPNFRLFLKNNNLGAKFHLPFIIEQLYNLGLDFSESDSRRALGSELMGRLLRYGINNVLRNIKHRARIPVPHSYQLVGVADEGATYITEGGLKEEEVFTLKSGFIYGLSHLASFYYVARSRQVQHAFRTASMRTLYTSKEIALSHAAR
jgi:RNA-dependent RNA polymerase